MRRAGYDDVVADEWWDFQDDNRPRLVAGVPELLWSLRLGPREKTCVVIFRGESFGWELRLDDDGWMLFGHRFALKEPALKLAGELREELEREGWEAPEAPTS